MLTKKKLPLEKAVKDAIPMALQKAGNPFEVSQSVLRTWRRCQAKYDYQYRQLLKRKRPRLPLIRGTMIGQCLDAMVIHRVSPGTKAVTWQAVLTTYETQYKRLFEEEKEMYGDLIGDVRFIMQRYERIYANDGLEYQLGKDGLPYEIHLELELVPGITYVGHIDKMPMDKYGRIWDMDHKSHKKLPTPEDRFMDLQQVFYTWAAPLSGYPKLIGVIWDYLRTKRPAIPEKLVKGGLSKRKNIDTDYETYMEAVVANRLSPQDYADILGPLKARGHMDFYQRIQLPSPNPEMVKSVVDDAKATAIEIQKLGGSARARSMDRLCKSCEFFEICQAEFRGLDADFIRKSEYVINDAPRHDHSDYTEED